MIALLDNGQDLENCAAEMGGEVGQLLTPLTRYRLRNPEAPWAIDNGAFAAFDAEGFMALLAREEHHRERCLFVTAPDVVSSARRTLEVFEHWKGKLAGWPIALACQDGQEHLPIPWKEIAAVFIGGSTSWKCSQHAAHIIKAAKALGKWAHVGRVNDPVRWKHFEERLPAPVIGVDGDYDQHAERQHRTVSNSGARCDVPHFARPEKRLRRLATRGHHERHHPRLSRHAGSRQGVCDRRYVLCALHGGYSHEAEHRIEQTMTI